MIHRSFVCRAIAAALLFVPLHLAHGAGSDRVDALADHLPPSPRIAPSRRCEHKRQ